MSTQPFHGSHVNGDGKAGRGVAVHGGDVNAQRNLSNGMNGTESGQPGFPSQQDAQVRSGATGIVTCQVLHVYATISVALQSLMCELACVDAKSDAATWASTADDAYAERDAARPSSAGESRRSGQLHNR